MVGRWPIARDLIKQARFDEAHTIALTAHHPEAQWFLNLQQKHNFQTQEQFLTALTAESDAFSYCYLWNMKKGTPIGPLIRYANDGLALAQAYLACHFLNTNDKRAAIIYADLALQQNERVGFYIRGVCEKLRDRKIFYFKKASDQGCHDSKNYLETLLKPTDPYLWHLYETNLHAPDFLASALAYHLTKGTYEPTSIMAAYVGESCKRDPCLMF